MPATAPMRCSPSRVFRWKAGRPVGAQRVGRLLARRLVASEVYVPWPGSSTLRPDDVTVVVPVRDRPAELDRVLGTLFGLACVVVDDASHDAPSTKAIAEEHGARFIGLEANVGPAGARNAGLAEVHSALVAFVDSDCILADGWLEPLLGHFDDPLVAAVAPRIVPLRHTPHDALSRYQRVRSPLDRGPVAGLVRPGGPIPFVPSAAILVRADVADGAHLFDPSLRGGEDVDLVWRLTEAGWDVRYEPASAVEHDGPATLGAFLGRQAFYGSTAAPLALRHPGALAPVRVSGWSLAVWALALARRPALSASTLALSVVILAARLDGLVRDPVAVATRIAGGGTARAAVPVLGGAARAWSPALVAALALRRTRRAALLALTVPALAAWAADRDALDPARFVALHVADDAAYGAGVWAGCVRSRTIEPLVPRVSWRSAQWARRTLRQTLADGGDGGEGEGAEAEGGGGAGTDGTGTPGAPRR